MTNPKFYVKGRKVHINVILEVSDRILCYNKPMDMFFIVNLESQCVSANYLFILLLLLLNIKKEKNMFFRSLLFSIENAKEKLH